MKKNINRAEDHWKGMPEFIQEDKKAFHRVTINFENEEDMQKFNEITDLKITKKTKGVFYPKKETERIEYTHGD